MQFFPPLGTDDLDSNKIVQQQVSSQVRLTYLCHFILKKKRLCIFYLWFIHNLRKLTYYFIYSICFSIVGLTKADFWSSSPFHIQIRTSLCSVTSCNDCMCLVAPLCMSAVFGGRHYNQGWRRRHPSQGVRGHPWPGPAFIVSGLVIFSSSHSPKCPSLHSHRGVMITMSSMEMLD